MSGRMYYEPGAGEWTAYRDEDRLHAKTGEPFTMRTYRARPDRNAFGTVTGTTSRIENARYDTKTEALAAAKDAWPRRVKGCRSGAERVPFWEETKR